MKLQDEKYMGNVIRFKKHPDGVTVKAMSGPLNKSDGRPKWWADGKNKAEAFNKIKRKLPNLSGRFNAKRHTEYCTCCGLKSKSIWRKLKEQKPDKYGKYTWEGHTLYKDADSFYEYGAIEYCGQCGEKLDEEFDVHTEQNRVTNDPYPMSETIVTGYDCKNCGFSEEY